jgi:glycogen operon protein
LPEAAGGRRWVRLIDTNQTTDGEMPEFEFGHDYVVTGRSLLLFVLRPDRTQDGSTAAERSFQRVVQTFEDAASKHVAFGFDARSGEVKPVPPAAPARRGRARK